MYEISRFAEDLPELKRNISMQIAHVRIWALKTLNIPYSDQEKYIDSATKQTLSNPSTILQKTFASLAGVFAAIIVVPVLLFLVLYYRVLFLNFFLRVFGEQNRERMATIIADSKAALQGYIAGLFMEVIAVVTLQSIAMFIIGAPYALLIGLITGILNLIPYVGIIIAFGMSLVISIASGSDMTHIFYMFIGFACVQFIDNNILLPNLVGSRISINAFFSIVGVIAGGVIAGVAGMFLSIPLMALMKVVFDNINHLKPWGELMSDSSPKTVRWKNIRFPRMD
jgi:predicted PurR-regulated permease PerM